MYPKSPRKLLPALFFLLFCICGLVLSCTRTLFASEDTRFQTFTKNLFKEEIQSNTLTLHYTLADPAAYGIHNYPITLGPLPTEDDETTQTLTRLQKKLQTFDYDALSLENRLTFDILKLEFETEAALSENPLLYEPLSPTLGIQAQLPVLLAEYTFRTVQDVEDYLALLKEIPAYFDEIIAFQQRKSQAGYFMSDGTAQRIIDQCNSFVVNPQKNYLLSVFEDKISDCDFLSEKKKQSYQTKHTDLILNTVIPAYETLANGLADFMGTGKNPYGLSHYPNGRDYYLTLVQSTTGIYDSIEVLTNRLYNQLNSDFLQIQRLLKVYPELPSQAQDETTSLQIDMEPAKILTQLQQKMTYDFPALNSSDYSVKYVHEALEPYLSPAFYLTPPIDTLTPNSIYLNNYNQQQGLTLYSTLAHEGFPGHMYQTLFFAQTNPDPIRHLFANGGFVEGWATYIETFACQYAPVSYEVGQYMALNRSFYLCLYSLLDIYIHYYGWTLAETSEYLSVLGITDAAAQAEIYQILIEDPANYLKYCLGSLYIQDLRTTTKEQIGNDFELLSFHETLLAIGPAPFPVIEKYLAMQILQK